MFSFICLPHHSSPPVTTAASAVTEYTVSGTNTKLLPPKNTFTQKRSPSEVKGQGSKRVFQRLCTCGERGATECCRFLAGSIGGGVVTTIRNKSETH